MERYSRYSRQILLPEIGEAGQARLDRASVLIVGAGGLGSPVAMYLAAAGVGRIVLVDDDVVSLSNLHRQILYSASDVGRPKVDCAARRLRELNPDVKVDPCMMRLDDSCADGLVRGCDLVMDCTDNFPARLVIDRACAAAGVPWVHGAVEAFSGHVALFGGAGRKRYADLFPDITPTDYPPKNQAIAGPTAGVVGSIMAAEAMKLLAGLPTPLDGGLQIIDLLTADHTFINF